ncbi:ATP-dependent protease La [Serendipita vermifera]|nr:ATP-dependent protease La [Serendipita vermifera]
MSLETAPTSLPVLALPSKQVLFPATQLTISLPRSLSSSLSRIVNTASELGQPPLLVAAPISNPNDTSPDKNQVSEWSCVARIVRFVRPTPLSPNNCILTLAGIARVQLGKPLPSPSSLEKIPMHPIHYSIPSSSEKSISEPMAETFRSAALRLVDRLDAESKNDRRGIGALLGKNIEWRKLRAVIEDAEADKTPWVADILCSVVPTLSHSDRLQMLSNPSPSGRVQLATSFFSKHASIKEVSEKINNAVDESLTRQQKEFYLRQQLKAIQRELANLNRPGQNTKGASSGEFSDSDKASSGKEPGASEFDEEGDDSEYLAEVRAKLERMVPGSEERKMGVKEYKRLKRIPGGSVEHGVVRTYLDWLTSLPWPTVLPDQAASLPKGEVAMTKDEEQAQSVAILQDPQFLTKAREQLDADHFGLDVIKRRLIEHLAVMRLKSLNATSAEKAQPVRTKGPILLLVGPPGCGKTSIASSLAKALARPFHRISLGGVRDEAEIRGFRRTYVASGPGSIINALSKVKRADPVILLDEIDKVGHASHQGDPAAALLEVLDPEQNISFKDHYIDVPFDLGQVTFIATANTLDTISEPLLDRCEVIRLSGYTYDEKINIAQRFLFPKQLEANGLTSDKVSITDDAYLHIASYYTREAGVRSLERSIGSIARWKAVEWMNQSDSTSGSMEGKYNPVVDVSNLETILGIPRWDPMEKEREERTGLVYGLVVSGHGEGGVLPVESVMTSGTGQLRLTGSLGDVIRESGEIALSWVKAHAHTLGITNSPSQDPLKYPHPIDIHLHLPSGAVKKDGPSAGVAYVCAFVSLLTGLTVSKWIAMTGETTLRGRITAVGGIKEKVLGAHREGIRKVILPRANRKDVEHDVPAEIHRKMEFVYVSRVEEALEAAFGPGIFPNGQKPSFQVESRL